MYFPDNDYESTYFKLGKIFFKKYMLTFNHDSKRIGYYKNDNNEEGKEKETKLREELNNSGNSINSSAKGEFKAIDILRYSI